MSNQISKVNNQIILTGDRPTGLLHLGHYVGSLTTRIELQTNNTQYIMIANIQALTDNMHNREMVQESVYELVKDYLSVGIEENSNIIFLQSEISALAEMTMIFLNCVTYNRLIRNPTLKQEIGHKYSSNNPNIGFLCYPISQAADILAFNADLVPVGQDQIPIIEQCNEIVEKINTITQSTFFKKVQHVMSQHPKLPGINGNNRKMSKSLNNAIYLSDDSDTLKRKVFSMFTDPQHIKVTDPGNVENNTVFTYLDIFFHDKMELSALKKQYQKGGLGDITLKKLLFETLENLLSPIREKRRSIDNNKVKQILKEGNYRANKVSKETIKKLKEILKITY